MKVLFRIILMAAIISLVCPDAHGQDIPVNPKFGAVSDKEIDMKVYDRDTSAAAILLYRSYTVRIGISANATLNRTIRVHDRWKILKESGKGAADYEILCATGFDEKEIVSNIKATTFNRLPDGKAEQIKMSKKSRFDEKFSDSHNKVSFAPEGVKEGSVVDVAFEIQSPTVTIPDIYLQLSDYPVNQIDVDVCYADFFVYNRITRGYLSSHFHQETENETITTAATGPMSISMYHDYYSASDVPAMREESFCYCSDQYRMSVCYDLRSVAIPGVISRDYHAGWDQVDKAVANSPLLSQVRQKFRDADEIRQLMESRNSTDEQILAIWQYILDRVKWNEETELLPQDNKQTLKEGSGSSADMNALMASALNTAGFVAEPVLVKLRTQGILLDYHISSSEFGAFLLRIKSPDGTVRYLDAARKDSYFNVLNPNYLVSRGRLVHLDGHGEWIDLTALPVTNQWGQVVKLTPDPAEGVIRGSSDVSASNQCAYAIKTRYHSFDSPERWIEDSENKDGIEILEMKIEGEDQRGNTALVSTTFEDALEQAGEFLYIHPFVTRWHDREAFRDEQRKLPVDFPYKERINYMCIINVPEGYTVEQLPAPTRGTIPDAGGASYLLQCQQVSNIIQLSFRMEQGALQIQEKDYAAFRDFWDHLCQVEESVIVMKKP